MTRRGLAAGALALLALTAAAPAVADDGRIAHAEGADGRLELLVDLPAGAQADLSDLTVTVDGEPAAATAEIATGTTTVRRTAVLAVDLSRSMDGPRYAAARAAARTFVRSAPDDVYIGIVGFASDVTTLVEPTTDRRAAMRAFRGVSTSRGTRLYDGVAAAADVVGSEGQRTLLAISDGADTSDVPLDDALTAITDGGLSVDVVALDQGGTAVPGLQEIAAAGGGEVIPADPAALAQAFGDEAAMLAGQVAVSVELPARVVETGATEGDVSVSIGTDAGSFSARAYSPFGVSETSPDAAATPGAAVPTAAVSGAGGPGVPVWLAWAGPAVLGLGLVLVLVLLVPRRPAPMSPAERVTTYAGSTRSMAKIEPEQALSQAKDVAADLLERNRGLEVKISRRLEAAGSELRPAEWLLVHGAIFVVSGLLGLVLGKGSIVLGLLFMVAGFFGPWLYLGLRKGRRRKAFNRALPDTLQLMSGSLAAGLSLAQSVDTIVREGPTPINEEFKRVLVETRLGVSLEDALDGISERFESKDFEWVVMAIRIQRQVGGNLAELLDTVAATMREREYIRRQVAALAAEGKLSAYVLGGLPPAFLLYLLATNRDYVIVLFTEPVGWAMLTGGALLLSLGVFWMSRLIKVEI